MSDRLADVVIQCSNHDAVPRAWLIKVKELNGSMLLSIKSTLFKLQNSTSSEQNTEYTCNCMYALESPNTKTSGVFVTL